MCFSWCLSKPRRQTLCFLSFSLSSCCAEKQRQVGNSGNGRGFLSSSNACGRAHSSRCRRAQLRSSSLSLSHTLSEFCTPTSMKACVFSCECQRCLISSPPAGHVAALLSAAPRLLAKLRVASMTGIRVVKREGLVSQCEFESASHSRTTPQTNKPFSLPNPCLAFFFCVAEVLDNAQSCT